MGTSPHPIRSGVRGLFGRWLGHYNAAVRPGPSTRPYKPISDYGVIGDRRTAALVGLDGSIDWCCLPRFDSPSLFAAMLDHARGGRFQIAPAAAYRSTQAYLPSTNILTTTFHAPGGTGVLTDFMPCGGAGVRSPQIHRMVRCAAGTLELRLQFQPRFDYARAATTVSPLNHGAVAAGGGASLALASAVPLQVGPDAAEASFRLRTGEEAWFSLEYGARQPGTVPSYEGPARLAETRSYWQEVALGCPEGGRWHREVLRSFLTLHLLTYEPTGAIVAAPTTSLPEELGGPRNWDYRYCWVRDAALTVDSFFRLGHTDEAEGFMRWLMDRCSACGDQLQPLYGIEEDSPLQEVVLDHLEGYRGSRPVRIGNAAVTQLQLDIFGAVLIAVSTYYRHTRRLPDAWWELVRDAVATVGAHWRRPDRGIWEVRGEERHFLFSKLMCWVTVDRGISLARALGKPVDLERWRAVRAEIREEILSRGWHPGKQAFVQHYETSALDASLLLMPQVGFLPATDARIQTTIQRVQEELSLNGLVRRYRPEETDDGLVGPEGAFTLCSFWLVGALLLSGRVGEAEALFRRLLGYANHMGLFSEMVDPYTGEALGNFPQALTHMALIHTARNLHRALQEPRLPPPWER